MTRPAQLNSFHIIRRFNSRVVSLARFREATGLSAIEGGRASGLSGHAALRIVTSIPLHQPQSRLKKPDSCRQPAYCRTCLDPPRG